MLKIAISGFFYVNKWLLKHKFFKKPAKIEEIIALLMIKIAIL